MKKFKKLYVEITNACNMSCSFCPGTIREERFMDSVLFEKIMKDTQGRALHTYFHVMGEPLMHPDIPLFMDIADKYGHRVSITTNGTLLSRLEYILDKKSLRNINFSLHSIENGSPDEGLEAIFTLARKALGTGHVSVSFRLWNQGRQKGSNAPVLRAIEKNFCPEIPLDDKNTAVNGIRIGDRLFVNMADEFEWPSPDNPEVPGPAYCKGMREMAAILADGTVTACCLDKDGVINLGDINTDSFENITESSRARAIAEGFGKRVCSEDLCKKCTYRKRFS